VVPGFDPTHFVFLMDEPLRSILRDASARDVAQPIWYRTAVARAEAWRKHAKDMLHLKSRDPSRVLRIDLDALAVAPEDEIARVLTFVRPTLSISGNTFPSLAQSRACVARAVAVTSWRSTLPTTDTTLPLDVAFALPGTRSAVCDALGPPSAWWSPSWTQVRTLCRTG
jgi:hypothetical protein